MKKILIITTLVFLINNVFAQANFNWEKVDSVAKTKSQIYSDTKLFIAKTWQSAKAVIENDDKEAGVILVKGKSVQSFAVNLGLCPMEYVYNYMVTFKMKDGKYKIIVENLQCSSAHGGTDYLEVRRIGISDEIPYPLKTGSITRKRAEEMMTNLKAELQAIVDSYLITIKYTASAGSSKDNW